MSLHGPVQHSASKRIQAKCSAVSSPEGRGARRDRSGHLRNHMTGRMSRSRADEQLVWVVHWSRPHRLSLLSLSLAQRLSLSVSRSVDEKQIVAADNGRRRRPVP